MRSKIEQIIDGVRYDTEKAFLIASDEYFDGNNWERRGRNTHLYKTKKGRFFAGHSSQWQGESGHIEALSKEDAMSLYESLAEHNVSYEDAFGVQPEEA